MSNPKQQYQKYVTASKVLLGKKTAICLGIAQHAIDACEIQKENGEFYTIAEFGRDIEVTTGQLTTWIEALRVYNILPAKEQIEARIQPLTYLRETRKQFPSYKTMKPRETLKVYKETVSFRKNKRHMKVVDLMNRLSVFRQFTKTSGLGTVPNKDLVLLEAFLKGALKDVRAYQRTKAS